MAVISGIGGSITGAAYITAVRNWSMTIGGESLETTDMNPASSFRTRIGGLKTVSGSYSAFIDGTVFASIDDQLGGTPSAATFALVSGSTEPNIQGTILITDVSVTANTDGPVEVEFTFEGSAEPTLSNT